MYTHTIKRFHKLALVLALVGILSAFAAVPAAQAADVAASSYCTQWHLIQRGENLFRIALRYGTTVAYLKSLNNIVDVNRIYAGQQLCISQASSGGSAYVVQRGDTLFRIAQRYGVNMWVLAQHNSIQNVNRIYAGQTLYIPDVTIQL